MEIRKVGVVGAGVMGVGLGQAWRRPDMKRSWWTFRTRFCNAPGRRSGRGCGFQACFQKANRREIGDRPGADHLHHDLAALADVDFLIENVPETVGDRATSIPASTAICPQRGGVRVNTPPASPSPVWQPQRSGRPGARHAFHESGSLKPMVEAIRAFHTSDETLERGAPTPAPDGNRTASWWAICRVSSPHRILMLTVNEAVFVLQDGVPPPMQVDQLFKTVSDTRWDPLETADLIGSIPSCIHRGVVRQLQ